MANPSVQGQADRAHREPDDHPPGDVTNASWLVSTLATMSASAWLTSWLVRRSSRSASGLACASCTSRAFRGPAAPDQLHHPRDDADELVIVGSNATEQLDLVSCDELQAVQVVAELVELPEDAVEAPLVGDEQRGGHAVQLGRRVVLKLAVGGDLPLQLHEVFRPAIDLAEHLETDGAERDEQAGNGQKGNQELGVHRGRYPRDEARERVASPAPLPDSTRRSRSISSGSNRTPMY